jgi:hypothetical protein
LASTLCHGDNTEPPVPSLHAFTQHARLCPHARNSQKRKYTCESDVTVRAKASLSSPAAALEADSIHHTTRRRRTQKSSRRMKSSVGTTIRGNYSQLITSSATVTTSRQLRFRPSLTDKLQYKTFDTNDPVLPIETIQQYPHGYDSTKLTQWNNLERTGRGRT